LRAAEVRIERIGEARIVPLVAELESRHREIRKAIDKMNKGTYGHCDVCKEAIDIDRLEANPAAATCIDHA